MKVERRQVDEFVLVHASLHHSMPWRMVLAYLRWLLIFQDADLITTTETKRKHRPALKALQQQHDVRYVHRGETAIIWRHAVFAKRHRARGRLLRITNVVYRTGKGAARRFDVALLWLRHRSTGRRLRVSSGHGPASVQKGSGWSGKAKRVLAARRGWPQWGRRNRRLLHRRPDVAQIAAYDGNLDQHVDYWQGWLEEQLGLTSVYATEEPKVGTLGRRLADGVNAHQLQVLSVDIVRPRQKRMRPDHRAVRVRFRITAPGIDLAGAARA